MSWRESIRQLVTDNQDIDIVIVHHADGSNDFFSAKPEVERCERWRVIQVCKDIIRALEEMPRKSRSCISKQRGLDRPEPACPVDGAL